VSPPRPALLDVNVLIALFDADHIHHDIAHDWFAENRRHRWATCALTQNGFLRVLTNVRSGVESDQATIFASLRTLCSAKDHVFWQNSVSLLDESLFDSNVLVSHIVRSPTSTCSRWRRRWQAGWQRSTSTFR
jgi:predicted nucleic acid-binding protein